MLQLQITPYNVKCKIRRKQLRVEYDIKIPKADFNMVFIGMEAWPTFMKKMQYLI